VSSFSAYVKELVVKKIIVKESIKSGWWLNLYPQAGEASATFMSALREAAESPFKPAVDKTRANEEAARRARGKVRRYCAANRLNRLGTLTYEGEGCHDSAQLRSDVSEFFRKIKKVTGENIPYVWVPEWHKTNHGLHVHFAVGRYIPVSEIRNSWGRGFVHIKLLSDLPVGSTDVHEARVAAGYLGKYIGKDLGDNRRIERLHRYDLAQGFTPSKLRFRGNTSEEVVNEAISRMAQEPVTFWNSNNDSEWTKPPAIWMAW